jgi:hypothetical protein
MQTLSTLGGFHEREFLRAQPHACVTFFAWAEKFMPSGRRSQVIKQRAEGTMRRIDG